MAIPSALDAQIGFAAESTYGTYVTPTRFVDFDDESFALDRQNVEGVGLRPGRRYQSNKRYKANRKGAAGDVTLPFVTSGMGLFLDHMMGGTTAIATPGGATDARTHTATPGSLTGKMLTAQVNRPDVSGADRPFSYLGCKVASWELTMDVDGILMLRLSFDARDEDTTESLASASYAASDELLVFTGATVSIAGSNKDVSSFSLSGDNGLKTDRYFLKSSPLKEQPLEASRRTMDGSVAMEFDGLTDYNRYVNATEAQIIATFEGSEIESGFNNHLKVTLPACRFDGTTPNVTADDVTSIDMPFTVLDDGSNPVGTLEYQTEDTAL